jgi:hypothetical protein
MDLAASQDDAMVIRIGSRRDSRTSKGATLNAYGFSGQEVD